MGDSLFLHLILAKRPTSNWLILSGRGKEDVTQPGQVGLVAVKRRGAGPRLREPLRQRPGSVEGLGDWARRGALRGGRWVWKHGVPTAKAKPQWSALGHRAGPDRVAEGCSLYSPVLIAVSAATRSSSHISYLLLWSNQKEYWLPVGLKVPDSTPGPCCLSEALFKHTCFLCLCLSVCLSLSLSYTHTLHFGNFMQLHHLAGCLDSKSVPWRYF